MSKVIAGVILLLVIAIGLFIWDKGQAQNDCEDRAIVAATDTYPINEYPDTAERSRLQATYKQTYMESCR